MNRLVRTIAQIGRQILLGEHGLVPIDSWLRFRRISYRVTPSHLEIFVGDIAERRIPLDQVVDATPVGDSFGRPFRFWRFLPPWKYERWGNRLGRPVLIRRRQGPHLLETPSDPHAFLSELEQARKHN